MIRRRTLVLCVIAAGLLYSWHLSFAGNERGGGHVVACARSDSWMTVELLDYYETRNWWPDLRLDLSAGKTEIEKALHVLERLKRIDSKRAGIYRPMVLEFFSEVQFVLGGLTETHDHQHISLPANCSIKQLAVQGKSHWASFYVINKELWKKLSMEHRAGLILHEVIYRDAREQGHQDSRNSRYVNALLSSSVIATIDLTSYLWHLGRFGLDAGK